MNPTVERASVEAVIAAIPFGRENAISRHMLASKTKLNDRTVRECIEQARRDGVFVIASPSGGYYQATTTEEIEAQYRIDRARALSVLARLTPMRRYLKAAGRDVE